MTLAVMGHHFQKVAEHLSEVEPGAGRPPNPRTVLLPKCEGRNLPDILEPLWRFAPVAMKSCVSVLPHKPRSTHDVITPIDIDDLARDMFRLIGDEKGGGIADIFDSLQLVHRSLAGGLFHE